MVKIYTITFLIFILCPLNHVAAIKNIDGSDSALIKRYWNRVNIKSLSSKGNNLYSGIDNYIQLIFPDKQSSTFQYYLSTNNGDMYDYDGSSYLTIPKIIGKSFVSIYVITNQNDTLLIGKKQFPVINLPLPVLKIGNTLISDLASVDKQAFNKGDTLKIFFTDDLPESITWYKIERFSIGYSFGRSYVSTDNNGAVFKDDAKKLLEKIKPNWEVNIKVNTVSPSGILRNLPLVKFMTY